MEVVNTIYVGTDRDQRRNIQFKNVTFSVQYLIIQKTAHAATVPAFAYTPFIFFLDNKLTDLIMEIVSLYVHTTTNRFILLKLIN